MISGFQWGVGEERKRFTGPFVMGTLIRNTSLILQLHGLFCFHHFVLCSYIEKVIPVHLFHAAHSPHLSIFPCFHLSIVLALSEIIFTFWLMYLCSPLTLESIWFMEHPHFIKKKFCIYTRQSLNTVERTDEWTHDWKDRMEKKKAGLWPEGKETFKEMVKIHKSSMGGY